MGKIKFSDFPSFEGKELWICALVHDRPGGNATLHLKPTKIIIKKHTGSYAPSTLRCYKLDKKGNQKQFDYGFTVDGNKDTDEIYAYNLFENELDCLECYSELNKEVLNNFEIWWNNKQLWAEKKISEYKKYIL